MYINGVFKSVPLLLKTVAGLVYTKYGWRTIGDPCKRILKGGATVENLQVLGRSLGVFICQKIVMRKTFVFYADREDYTTVMTNEEKWEFLQLLLDYKNDKDPKPMWWLKYIRPRIKKQLDEDEEKYRIACEANRENGKKWGRPKWSGAKQKKANESEQNQLGFLESEKKPKKHDNENDTENDIDNIDDRVNTEDQKELVASATTPPPPPDVVDQPKKDDPLRARALAIVEDQWAVAKKQAELARKKAVWERNGKLIDGIKKTLKENGMAYKPDRMFERARANLFFVSKDFAELASGYNMTPWVFALELCKLATQHKYWWGRVYNTVTLYDNYAQIHNDCKARFVWEQQEKAKKQEKVEWRKKML